MSILRPNRILAEPATPQACARDLRTQEQQDTAAVEQRVQRGGAYASAQDGQPRTSR
ncbi:hypothetical protein [Streptomyces sp. NPDC005732]|uniref:hypothetical protein n=1 Tax=Streptomyces sp. NPDC005732 TaxID=3157057 RepID=UPI0033BFF6D8